MLEHDGKNFVQSYSILRYLGKIHRYYPSTNYEAWAYDSILDAVDDFFQKHFKVAFEQDPEKK